MLERLFLLTICVVALIGCDSNSPESSADCAGASGNVLTALVDGRLFCASSVTDAPIAPGYHQLAGTMGREFLHVLIPLQEGTFALSEGTGIGGSYLPDTEGSTTYLSTGESGTIRIDELTNSRVKGTFAFVAQGVHQETTEPVGGRVHVTEGRFDMVVDL